MYRFFFFVLALIFLSEFSQASDWQKKQREKAVERAKYWKEQGYIFDSNYMSAYQMDQKVKDIKRAEYWKEKGYSFDSI